MKIVALRDKVEQKFRSLTVDYNEEAAKRNFAYAVNNSPELLFKSKDLELYTVGEFSDDSGVILPLSPPVLICRGDEVIAHD